MPNDITIIKVKKPIIKYQTRFLREKLGFFIHIPHTGFTFLFAG